MDTSDRGLNEAAGPPKSGALQTIHKPLWRVALLAVGLGSPALVSSTAWAYDGITVGQVAFIEGADETGFAFQLVGAPALCSNGSVWGAVKTRDGASPERMKFMFAMLMAARLSGAQVRVYAYNNPFECTVAALDSPL